MLLAAFVNGKMAAVVLFQENDFNFDPVHMWMGMGWPARAIAIILLLMSAWSFGVMIDRLMAFNAARKQSRQLAPVVAGALREGKLEEALRVADRNKKSHLARVLAPGLLEYQAANLPAATPEERIEAGHRALERAEAIVHTELERGLGGLATIGSTSPFVGLLGTVIGIIDAFIKMNQTHENGLTAVAGGISEALVTTALGLFVAIPAVMMFNYFMSRIKAFDVEMSNSSSELVDYFRKRDIAARK